MSGDSNGDLSFLVIRHLCRLSQHVLANVLISEFFVLIYRLDEDQILAFEKCLEWEECDKAVLAVLDVDAINIFISRRYANIIDMVFRFVLLADLWLILIMNVGTLKDFLYRSHVYFRKSG